jgi:hypothetical protein
MNKTNASFVTDWPLLGLMGHARAWEKETDGYFIFFLSRRWSNRIFLRVSIRLLVHWEDESRVNRRKARLIDTPPLLHNVTGRLYFYFQGDTRNTKFYYP